MSKAAAVTLMIIIFIGGVVLGNLYGKRDLVNSRPPEILGDFTKKQEVQTESVQSKPEIELRTPLSIYNPAAKTSIYGSAALASRGSEYQLMAIFTRKPTSLSEEVMAGNFKLNLYKSDGSIDRELATFKFSTSSDTEISTNFTGSPGQYLGITYGTTTEPILISSKIK